jgi:hypothetical protein
MLTRLVFAVTEKGKNDMARYIDADALCTYFKILYEHAQTNGMYNHAKLYDRAFQAVADAPTAEVVPKIEVEALQEALSKAEADVKNYMKVAEYQQSLSVKRYHEIKRLNEDVDRLQEINNNQVENIRLAKQEVAREIFAEIENEIIGAIKSNVKAIDERQEKINAYEDSFIVRCYGKIDALRGIDGFVEELKKKYTGEKT